MDFSKEMARGRRVAQAVLRKKKDKLITCWVTEDLRNEAYKKCPNVSEFIRVCLEKMVASNIDKQITKIYKDIAVDAIESVGNTGNGGNGHL